MGTGRTTWKWAGIMGTAEGLGIRNSAIFVKQKNEESMPHPCSLYVTDLSIASLSLAQLSKKEHLITELGSGTWSAESSICFSNGMCSPGITAASRLPTVLMEEFQKEI